MRNKELHLRRKLEKTSELPPVIDNKTLAIMFAGLLVISGIALKIRNSISQIDEISLLQEPPKKSTQFISGRKCNTVGNIPDFQSKYQSFLRDQSYQSDDEPVQDREVSDQEIVNNLNYCLSFAQHSAELETDKQGNKIMKIKDSNGKTVSEWANSPESEMWQRSGDDRLQGRRLCDSLENIAQNFCNNGINEDLDLQKDYSLLFLHTCPLTEEERLKAEEVVSNADDAWEREHERRTHMENKYASLIYHFKKTRGITTETDDRVESGNRLKLFCDGQHIGSIEQNQHSYAIHFIEKDSIFYHDFASIDEESTMEEDRKFEEFIKNQCQ